MIQNERHILWHYYWHSGSCIDKSIWECVLGSGLRPGAKRLSTRLHSLWPKLRHRWLRTPHMKTVAKIFLALIACWLVAGIILAVGDGLVYSAWHLHEWFGEK